jgi:type III restriction enzyme
MRRSPVHEKVVYESDTERSFAEDLEKNTAVKLYAKLPGWFTVPTPLGNYNPDWAVVVNADGTDRLYFVVETKSTLFDDALRDSEVAKIACGAWRRQRRWSVNDARRSGCLGPHIARPGRRAELASAPI